MKSFFAKSTILSLIVAFVAVLSLAMNVQASSPPGQRTPKVEKITEVTKTSIVVPFKVKRFANETVTVKVMVRNEWDSDFSTDQTFTTTLNDLGNGSVTVTGLMPAHEYSFKVRVNDSSFSDYRGGMTAG